MAWILGFEGKPFAPPGGDLAAGLRGSELAGWLCGAGYKATGGEGELDLMGFATAAYKALRPAV